MKTSPCVHLRTKRLYIPDLASEAFSETEGLESVNHYWCTRTMVELGADDRPVALEYCTSPGRRCYQTDHFA